ncbi:MAG: hypothetical protein M0R80_17060 [Proteobacteria bacterium]|jgi:hypothetical protein|nr:hypothetical protein [Pseudomonadota bacterium]
MATKDRRGTPQILVGSIHFEDLSGTQFERLCFGYVLRLDTWATLDWYGQLGGDSGRDIWGVRSNGETVCYQCANHKQLKFEKARADIGKIISGPNGVPNCFVLITGHGVTAKMKDRVKTEAGTKGIGTTEIWSGVELEERLRRDQPVLLKRFVDGVPFPELADALRVFGTVDEMGDDEILALMAECFDRPAFSTPFHAESSIPDFKKAITDTIEVLNTGVRRLRDGTEIGRIPSRHQLKKSQNKQVLEEITQGLTGLRQTFDRLVREGEIRPCGCGDGDCSTFTIDPRAAHEIDQLRWRILTDVARICPIFHPTLPPPIDRPGRGQADVLTAPRPDIRVTLAAGFPVPESPDPRLRVIIGVKIENHSPADFFFGGTVVFELSGGRVLQPVRDGVTGEWLAAKVVRPGDSISYNFSAEVLLSEAYNVGQYVVCARINDKIGRDFRSSENDMRTCLDNASEYLKNKA